MIFLSYLAAGTLFASCIASPLNVPHVVHEKRASSIPHSWTKREALDRKVILPMKVALAQRNLERGYEWLNEVSHPESKKYGQHWSAEDVANAFAPR